MLKKQKISTEYDKSTIKYLEEIGKYPSLTQQEEYALWKSYKDKHDMGAKEKLIKSNLKFVANVAKSFQGLGLSYADLIAEGNIGLIKGLEKFDGEKGYKLISYSVWWIKQSILEAINERNCSDAEDLPDDNINPDFDIEDIEIVDYVPEKSYFYDEEDSKAEAKQVSKDKVGFLMNFLSEKERFIIKSYWGLNGEKLTLCDIGEELGLTKERVRQINDNAIKKLRSISLSLEGDKALF